MVIYDSEGLYIESATSLADKICKIDAVIAVLFTTVLKAAGTDNFTEYVLDDGQTKIRATYKGADSVLKSIKVLETMKNYYVNQLNGRSFRLVDSKSFRRY